jgi:polyphosphate kinase
MGSSDWMHRNLSRRVEVVCPINDPKLRAYLKDEVLRSYLRDNVNAHELTPEGAYKQVTPASESLFDSQIYFEGADAPC